MNSLVQSILCPVSDADGHGRQLYRVHRKNGLPFALLPSNTRLQAQLAHLLPAQSWKARLYRSMVGLSGQVGLHFPRETDQIAYSEDSPLGSLIRKVSQSGSAPVLLPGNPNGVAPRLILICLDGAGSPVGVIKAGHTEAARDLVRTEYEVLKSLSSHNGQKLAPKAFDLINTAEISAFGMEFVSGVCPKDLAPQPAMESFLSSCLDQSQTFSIEQTDLWKNLVKSLSTASKPAALPALTVFSKAKVHPCLFHGDFAPWNVRERPDGTWVAIDWERGESQGIPGWDWLHFVIHPAILVKRWPFDQVVNHAKEAIRTPEFQRFFSTAYPNAGSELAGDLLRAYLLHNWYVLQPTERTEIHQALAEWASGRRVDF